LQFFFFLDVLKETAIIAALGASAFVVFAIPNLTFRTLAKYFQLFLLISA